MTALTAQINCTGIGLSAGNTFVAVVDDFQNQDPNVTSSSFSPSSVVWFKNITHSAGRAGATSSPSMFAMRAPVTTTDASGWVNVSVGVTDYLIVEWWVFPTAVAPVPRLLGSGTQGQSSQPYDALSGSALGDTLISTFASTRPVGTSTVYGNWNFSAAPANPPGDASGNGGMNSITEWKWVKGSFAVPDPTVTLQFSVYWSALSLLISATSPNALPAPPTGLTVTGSSPSSVTLSWTNPAGPLLNDSIVYSTGLCPLSAPQTSVSVGVHTSTTLSGLPRSHLFCFGVEAWNANGSSPPSVPVSGSTPPIFGFQEKTFALPGFDPLAGYFLPGNGNFQIPTLSSTAGPSFGIYYVNNASALAELTPSNGSVRTIAPVVPLYQLFGYGTPINGMLDNEFFLEYGYSVALFFGTTTSSGSQYSLELVDLNTGVVRMWNTTAPIDSYNQQALYVGNNTVIVVSSNCQIAAYNLASHQNWTAGTLGANFGPGSTCLEANNIYWLPQKEQLINVEAHHDSGDHVEQLDASFDAGGRIQFTSVATIAVDAGVVFNWVDGLAYNATTDRIAFSAGYWVGSQVYTYVVPYGANGLLTTSGETRYVVYNGGNPSGQLLESNRYVYTSDYMLGESYGPGSWTNGTQLMFDPWNGSVLPANRTFNDNLCGNGCFEGQYAPSPDYRLDFHASLQLNNPMYRVVYAYRSQLAPAPMYTATFTETGLPGGTNWSVTCGGSTEWSRGASIVFELPSGAYTFTVGSVTRYTAAPASGALTISTADVVKSITFSPIPPPKYAVTFTESGLASGTNWSVNLSGALRSSTGTTILFQEPNGTYPFTLGRAVGYTAMPSAGSVTVAGGAAGRTITFVALTYSVTFTETGLPAGTNWSITLDGSTLASTGSSIIFSEGNGSHSYTVSAVSGFSASPSSGQIVVTGKPLGVPIAFTAPSTSTPGFLGLSGNLGYYLVVAIAAIAVAGVAAALLLRRRKAAREPPESPPESPQDPLARL